MPGQDTRAKIAMAKAAGDFPEDRDLQCRNAVGQNWDPCIRYWGHRFDGSKLRCRSTIPNDTPSTNPDGTCQACFKAQKVQKGRMSLHGYQRPGYGYIMGRCIGAQELPYEHSCEVTKRMVDVIQDHLSRQETLLADLKDGPEEVTVPVETYVGYENTLRKERGYKTLFVTVKKGDAARKFDTEFKTNGNAIGGREFYQGHVEAYDRVLQRRIQQVEAELKATARDLEFFKEKVSSWTRQELKVA